MAASSCNYLVIYDGISQVYGTASEATALSSVPPKGTSTEDKHVFFVTWEPDARKLVVYELDKKEVEDALNKNAAADMSRAKQLKSLFRMVTPHLTMKDIPMVVVNHTYKEIGLYPKDIVGGGTGSYYSADNIFILGRQQEKEGTEVIGYNFIINVEKSRYVKEKSKIPVSVSFDGGISKWSGLLDIALESGHVIKPSNGWYSKVDKATGEVEEKKYRLKDTETKEFWLPILTNKSFYDAVKDKYSMGQVEMVQSDNLDAALEALDHEE